jgi:hypothetical protein
MKVSGFTFVRNARRFDFPIVESIQSILPIVDEYVVNVGRSEDDTLNLVDSIRDPKIKIIENVWDEKKQKDGEIYREQTDIALNACTGDWAFYLQADEVFHEQELPKIKALMNEKERKMEVLGFLFRYLHFYGDYWTLNPWFYHKEIRIIRNNGKIRSIGDACGFYFTGDTTIQNLKDRPANRIIKTDCHIYHYGWVKNPQTMLAKKIFQESRYQGMDSEIVKELSSQDDWKYDDFDIMKNFQGTHPAVMQDRIGKFRSIHSRPRNRWLNPRFYKEVFTHGFKG